VPLPNDPEQRCRRPMPAARADALDGVVLPGCPVLHPPECTGPLDTLAPWTATPAPGSTPSLLDADHRAPPRRVEQPKLPRTRQDRRRRYAPTRRRVRIGVTLQSIGGRREPTMVVLHRDPVPLDASYGLRVPGLLRGHRAHRRPKLVGGVTCSGRGGCLLASPAAIRSQDAVDLGQRVEPLAAQLVAAGRRAHWTLSADGSSDSIA
jgi:hypothetical protein